MEASATTQADRKEMQKAMQAAIKDITKVLAPSPKLNLIGGADYLARQIVKAISACIGQDEKGDPTWTNEKAGDLSPETIAIYEKLVLAQQEAEKVEKEPEPKPATKPQLAGAKDCEAFLASAGPDEAAEACAICAKYKECTEKAKKAAKAAKPEKAASKPKTPAEPKYTRATAFLEALRAGGTKDKIATDSNASYMEKTGKKDNLPEAKFWTANFLRLLEEMDLVQEQDGVITLK